MITKNVLIASTLMLASVPALFAASPGVLTGSSRAPQSQPARNPAHSSYAEASDWTGSISVEGFYGSAQKKLLKYDLDELDIGGVSFRYTATRSEPLPKTQSVYPEFFGMFSLGGGSLDQTWYGYYESEELNYDLFTTQLSAGCNLRCPVSERVSVFAGVRAGLAYENLDVEWRYNSRTRYSGNEDALGFLYGGEIGANFLVNEKLSLFACVGYVASTARPEFDVYGDKYKLKAQSYLTFSFGVRYMF